MTENNKRASDLIKNYDNMTEEGKKKLLLLGEKYLTETECMLSEGIKDSPHFDEEKTV
jgi:hypothetical protein